MSDKLGQIQEQKLTQGQKLTQTISQQQMLVSSLVELPVNQLVDRINTEMNDNPALESEANYDTPEYLESPDYSDDAETNDDFSSNREREERQSALDDALAGIGRDDEDLPVYHGGSNMSE